MVNVSPSPLIVGLVIALVVAIARGQACPGFRSFLDPIPVASSITNPLEDAAFSVDGATIYFTEGRNIRRIDPSGAVQLVATIADGLGGPYYVDLYMANGEERIAVTRPKDNKLMVGSVGTTLPINLTDVAVTGLSFPTAVRFLSATAATTQLIVADSVNNRVALVTIGTGVTVATFATHSLLFSPRFLTNVVNNVAFVASTLRLFRMNIANGAGTLTPIGQFVTTNGMAVNLHQSSNLFIAVGNTVQGSTAILPSSSTGTLGSSCRTFSTSASFVITGASRVNSFLLIDSQTAMWKFNYAQTQTAERTLSTTQTSSSSTTFSASMSQSLSMSASLSSSLTTTASATPSSTSSMTPSAILRQVTQSIAIPIVVGETISAANIAAINSALATDAATYASLVARTPTVTFASSNGTAFLVNVVTSGGLSEGDLMRLQSQPWPNLRTRAGQLFSSTVTLMPSLIPNLPLTPTAARDAIKAAIERDVRAQLLPRATAAGYLDPSIVVGTPTLDGNGLLSVPLTIPTAIAGTVGTLSFPQLTALTDMLVHTTPVTIPVNLTGRTLTPAEEASVRSLGTLDATETLGFPATFTNVAVVNGTLRGTLTSTGSVLDNGTIVSAPTFNAPTVAAIPWTRVVGFLNPIPAAILPPVVASCGTSCRIAVGIIAGIVPLLLLACIVVMCLYCLPLFKALWLVFPLW